MITLFSIATFIHRHRYGFHDSHSQMAMYYVTLSGRQLAVPAVVANDATMYSATFSPANLTEGALYRVVVRGVNNGGLSTSIVFAVEAHMSGASVSSTTTSPAATGAPLHRWANRARVSVTLP